MSKQLKQEAKHYIKEQLRLLNEAVNPNKKLKKELDNSLKGIRKNNFAISRAFNKLDRNKAKKAMTMYKKYIIEYQIRMHKLLREMK